MLRRISVTALACGIVVFAAAPAWAHVTVAPPSAKPGATDLQLTFQVPNEESCRPRRCRSCSPPIRRYRV